MRPRASSPVHALALTFALVAGAACAAEFDDPEGEAASEPEPSAATATVTASLDRAEYAGGDVMTLTVVETYSVSRTTSIADSGGHAWSKKSDNGKTLVFTATAKPAAGSFTVAVTVKPSSGTARTASAAYRVTSTPATAARWPGHQPGRIYLGMSTPSDEWSAKLAALAPETPGVRRKFYEWNDATAEDAQIDGDHAAGRLPWVSFKPPVTGGTVPQRWDAITSGAYDADIRARAHRYADAGGPVVVTFHHEPSNDAADADGVKWANAWIHIHDVMEAETGLENVAFAPILGEFLFNPSNSQEPEKWITAGVIARQPFLGIDLYQNGSGDGFEVRLGRIITWLADHGDPDAMVGIGETGSTDHFFDLDAADPTAVEWWEDSWAWAVAHTDRIGVVSYFNSTRNSKPDLVWELAESTAKVAAFREALASPVTCRLP
ncbi:MAG TPA: hypothetical protein VMZ28_14755 [Kofleriaceae bacterium]|nr:hypothetical protein [Kofleriaceae bacterium]